MYALIEEDLNIACPLILKKPIHGVELPAMTETELKPEAAAARNSERVKPDGMPADLQTHGHTVEIGGPRGLEPTRYGDWEKNGRCIDF